MKNSESLQPIEAGQTDSQLLDWLQEQVVDVIYLDDGRIIDVAGDGLRSAIRKAMYKAAAPGFRHGINCPKVEHDPDRAGYLHAHDWDGGYDVDGCDYCGRCHVAL